MISWGKYRGLTIVSVQQHFLGAILAITSAGLWAVAAYLFAHISKDISAKALNLSKGIIALACLFVFIIPKGFPLVGLEQMLALALSGIIGICIGDTLYFSALKRLGARLTLLIGNLIPVTTAVLAVLIFQERLSLIAWCGVLLIISGVTYVVWYREAGNSDKIKFAGVLFASLFVFAEAVGILLTKFGVAQLTPMEATFIRQIWGVACLSFWGLSSRSLGAWMKPVWQPYRLKILVIAAILGAFLGTYLAVAALKYTYVAVAATLNSTSPIFALLIAFFVLKKKIRINEVLGVGIATVGVALYFLSL